MEKCNTMSDAANAIFESVVGVLHINSIVAWMQSWIDKLPDFLRNLLYRRW